MSLLQLELIKLRLPSNATLIAFNHNVEIVAYTYYSPTRKVYYVVIESLNPIRLCFRKKLTSLHWIYIDHRDILITSFVSGYIGCFDIDGRLLFKQQIDNNPILNIYLHSSHQQLQNKNHNNVPNLLCLQANGVILITSYDLYATLKYSNFDISLLSQQQRKEYFLKIEYDKKKQQNKLKQQTHLKYSRNIHNNSNTAKHRRFTFDDTHPIRATAAISPRVVIAPLAEADDGEIDMLPPTYHQYERLKNQQNGELYACMSSPSTPNTPNTPDFVFSSSSSPSPWEGVKHSKINRYAQGVNSIPITTILPLRPICNKILYWNAKKILVSTDQKLTCFAACFFPLSENNKIEKELEESSSFGRRPHPGFNLNLSTHNLSNSNLIQTNNIKKRSQSAHNLYAHHHRSHSETDSNQNNNNNKQYTHNDGNLTDLINPQIAFKNNNDESWLILLCGSNPMIGAIHIEIVQDKHIKTNDKSSQSATSWFAAAKSLFLHKKAKTNTNKNELSAITIPNATGDNISEIGRSPSKSPRAANKKIYSRHNLQNMRDKKKKKKQNREQILLAQKHTQHTIRDQKYSKYLTNFELPNSKFFNKKANRNNLNANANVNHCSIVSVVMSPDSEYGAFTDSFGRIWIWDCKQCHFVRLFKGYRRAQIAWCYVNNDVDKLISCINGDISDMEGYGHKYDNGRASTNITNIISSVVFAIKKKEKERRRDIFGSIPSYIYRRSILLLVLYIASRGLLEFHYIGCYKRLYAVNVFKKATMIYHLNYSVSPPWTSILFVRKGQKNNNKNKVYKLKIDSSIIHNNNTALRRMTDVWDRKNLHCNSPIKLLSDQQIYFNGNYSQRFSIFGTQYISPMSGKKNNIIQWFVLVNKCDGDVCVGIQLIDRDIIKPQTQNHGDFANEMNGWGYHCDGFLKCNASFSRYGWKYGKYDTIGIVLNINSSSLKFSLNGKLCSRNNGLTLPNVTNGNLIYRLAVSVGLNSVGQLTIIGFCK